MPAAPGGGGALRRWLFPGCTWQALGYVVCFSELSEFLLFPKGLSLLGELGFPGWRDHSLAAERSPQTAGRGRRRLGP